MPAIDLSSLANELPSFAEHFARNIQGVSTFRGDLTVELSKETLRSAVQFLKVGSVPTFPVMMDLCGTDYLKYSLPTPERFAVRYHFYSIETKKRLFLKVWVSEEEPKLSSIQDIYAGANWFERETWDMYGIVFEGHPNLVRILCHNEFVGHPLRKDYPAAGYQQLKSPSKSTEF